MTILKESVTLRNHIKMPKLGLGIYNISNHDITNVIKDALEVGYRHLETAPIYLNEQGISEAIRLSNLDRDDLFITSKVPPHIKTYDGTIRVIKRSMKKLGVDYLDAVLINNPVPWGEEGKDYLKENLEVYKALEELYNQEVIAAIGISNFSLKELADFLPHVAIKPHIHQIGVFIGHALDELVAFCHEEGITVQAHSPLARGRVFKHELLIKHAQSLNVTPAQLALKYVIIKNTSPIVKTTSKARMIENSSLDFHVPHNVIAQLDEIKKDIRDYLPPGAKSTL